MGTLCERREAGRKLKRGCGEDDGAMRSVSGGDDEGDCLDVASVGGEWHDAEAKGMRGLRTKRRRGEREGVR